MAKTKKSKQKKRNFKAEFDEWFEKCALDDVEYAVKELDRYAWLEDVRNDAIEGGEGGQDAFGYSYHFEA